MATQYRKLLVKDFPKPEVQKESIEQLYWKEFKFPTVVKEFSAINYIDISPVKPYNALVTCAGKVQIFNKSTDEVIRTSSRSKENVYGARYRDDGKLMVTGGDSGLVQVLDTQSRAILRNLRGHTATTRVCSFGKEKTQIFSASDDKTVRQWDLPTEKEIRTLKASTDFIRCGCLYPKNPDQFFTGSYDHMVKMWDFRSNEKEAILSLNHGAPVESVIVHSIGGICISSGSNFIKVWDIIAGGRLLFQFSNHQKTVTTLTFDGDESRLLSGSLDRNVKVYNVFDYSVVATLNYPSPILSMGLSKDESYLVVGMADGAISLQHRKESSTYTPAGTLRANNKMYFKERRSRDAALEPYTLSKKSGDKQRDYKSRNSENAMPKKNDVIIKDEARFKVKLTKLDRYLQKFQYQEAFEVAMTRKEDVIISLLIELDRRDALEIAMKNQEQSVLLKFVKFLSRNIANALYTKILHPVTNLFLDIYTPMMVKDEIFRKHLINLNAKLKEDLHACQEMMRLLGAVEQVFILSTPPPSSEEIEPVFTIDENNKDNENSEDLESGEQSEKIESDEQSEKIESGEQSESQDTDVDFEIRESNTEIVIDDDSSS